jgi:hypothetical protein
MVRRGRRKSNGRRSLVFGAEVRTKKHHRCSFEEVQSEGRKKRRPFLFLFLFFRVILVLLLVACKL